MIAKKRKSKKRHWTTTFFSIFFNLLVIAIVVFLAFTNWRLNKKRAENQERIDVFQKEIQDLEGKIATLRAGIIQTQTEDYQTAKLYEQGYVQKGATQVVVLPPEQNKEKEIFEEKKSWNPQNWLEWLKSKLWE